jgi:hypothetical protein
MPDRKTERVTLALAGGLSIAQRQRRRGRLPADERGAALLARPFAERREAWSNVTELDARAQWIVVEGAGTG